MARAFRFRSVKQRRRPTCRLTFEVLEDRCVPASGLSANLVADILPGTASSNPKDFANINGSLYFSATDPTGQQGLYRSDGTAAGTTFLKTTGPAGSTARDYTAVGSNVIFSSNGYLWITDGSRNGTKPIVYINPIGITAMGGKLYFSGWGNSGQELYVSDGTKKGTKLLKDIDPRTHEEGGGPSGDPRRQVPNSSVPGEFVVLNGTLLFAATDVLIGRELWRSDGTANGTILVKDLGSGDSSPRFLTVMNGAVYFAAESGLWRTDGTTAGTTLLRASTNGFSRGITSLTAVNGAIYFAASDAINGPGLWKSDGTAIGTVLVKNIDAANHTNVGGRLFFAGSDAAGSELWTSDGTTAGTVRVTDVNPGGGSSSPTQLTNVNGLLYFSADDGTNGRELWQSNGTPAGTQMVRDIYPGATGSNPAYLVGMNNKLYFAANDPDHGRELWDPPPVHPETDQLFVANFDQGSVLRYDVSTSTYIDTFITKHSGGLTHPYSVLFGPHDGDLYVSTQSSGTNDFRGVLRFDGRTGAFVEEFTRGVDLQSPRGFVFGPDGNLYLAERKSDVAEGRILRFDGHSGQYLDDFVPWLSGGLKQPTWLLFGPSARGLQQFDLYVSNGIDQNILRFDGTTGAALGEFVASRSGGLESPTGLSFGPDGNLYVTATSYLSRRPSIIRFQGPNGTSPGALIDQFIPAYSDGKRLPFCLLFGPDGNGDGYLDLYVNDAAVNSGAQNGKKGSVKRFDGITGSFIDTLVPNGDHGLQHVGSIAFTHTNPMTLAYEMDHFQAVSLPAEPMKQTFRAKTVKPLFTEALACWRVNGAATATPGTLTVRMDDLSGKTVGLHSSDTIWLDNNAAGGGWFSDPVPWNNPRMVKNLSRPQVPVVRIATVTQRRPAGRSLDAEMGSSCRLIRRQIGPEKSLDPYTRRQTR